MVAPRWMVLAVLLVVVGTACFRGGGENEEDAQRYADEVCAASLALAEKLEPAIPSLRQAAKVIEDFESLKAVGAALKGLGGVVDQMAPEFSTFVDTLGEIDPPDVDGGLDFHGRVFALFDDAEPGFEKASKALAAIPDDPKLTDLAEVQSGGVSESLNVFTAYEAERDDAPEVVRTALVERPTCVEVDKVFDKLPEVLAG